VKVTPLDIRRKEFKRSMRGYADEEVDLFLDEVADDFERVLQENVELQERIRRVEEQLAGNTQLRDALEKTLVNAQIQADQTIANANKESELILRDSELRGRAIVSDSYVEVQRVQQALIQLKHLEEDFRFKFRSLLEGHIKLLDEAPINMVAGQPVVVQTSQAPAPTEQDLFEMPTAIEEVPEFPAAVAPTGEPQPEQPVISVAAAGVLAEAMNGLNVPAEAQPVAAQPAPVEETMATEETVALDWSGGGRAAAASEAVAPVAADIWGDEPVTAETEDSVTVEQASVFAKFDEAQAQGQVDEVAPAVAAKDEDPLSGFFFSGTSGGTDGSSLDDDTDGKSKPRDFEW
jgi:cell division initiation protein